MCFVSCESETRTTTEIYSFIIRFLSNFLSLFIKKMPLSEMTNENLQKLDIKDEELNSILDGLCKMFEEKHNRPPTEDEIKIWISQLKEVNASAE
jgi:hypothetical protein